MPAGVATSERKNLGVEGWPQNGSSKLPDCSTKGVVPLALVDDFWHTLEYEVAGMGISNLKSMVLCWKMVDYLLWMGGELLPQAKVFKYLGVLFMSDGRMEWDRQFGAASVVMQALHWTVV